MATHTWFWVSEDDKTLSPYFDSQEQAEYWLAEQKKLLTDPDKDC